MAKEGEALISIRVRPRSARSGVGIGADGGMVVSVHAPAAEGAANRECVAVLAKALGVAKSSVRIVRGERSRSKRVAVAGLSVDDARARLAGSACGDGRKR